MSKPLTTEEMAAELRFCTKTFRRYVRKYNIPHGGLGRNMRFDRDEVWAHLKALNTAEPALAKTSLKPKKVSKRSTSQSANAERYSQLLGLEGVH